MKCGRVQQILGPCPNEFRKTLPGMCKGLLNHFKATSDGLAFLKPLAAIGGIGQATATLG